MEVYDRVRGPYKRNREEGQEPMWVVRLYMGSKKISEKWYDNRANALLSKASMEKKLNGEPATVSKVIGLRLKDWVLDLWQAHQEGDADVIKAKAAGVRAAQSALLHIGEEIEEEKKAGANLDGMNKDELLALFDKRMSERKLRVVNASDAAADTTDE